jgi:hypothetical protein
VAYLTLAEKDMKSYRRGILALLTLGLISMSCTAIHATKDAKGQNISDVTVIGFTPEPLLLTWHPQMTLGSIMASREVSRFFSDKEESTLSKMNVTIEHPRNSGNISKAELLSKILPGDRITFETEGK